MRVLHAVNSGCFSAPHLLSDRRRPSGGVMPQRAAAPECGATIKPALACNLDGRQHRWCTYRVGDVSGKESFRIMNRTLGRVRKETTSATAVMRAGRALPGVPWSALAQRPQLLR